MQRLLLGPSSLAKAEGPKDYEKTGDVSGTLTSIGSDTLLELMNYWAEDFKKMYPNVTCQIEGKGSATAPPALTEGKALLGPMSRKMKPEEEDAFEAKHGFKPTRYRRGAGLPGGVRQQGQPGEGLYHGAVGLHLLEDPQERLRRHFHLGSGRPDRTVLGRSAHQPLWPQLGQRHLWLFQGTCLLKGDYKDTVKEQPGSAGVVSGVAKDRFGIGYSGIGYKTSEVRAVPLAKTENDKLVEPTFDNAINGTYPLGRTLYIYVAKKPGEPLPPLVKEFLKFVLSKQGQEIVVNKGGYGQLPDKMIEKNVKALD